jgi:hypothetical protein
VLFITNQQGKNLVAPIALYARKLFLNLFNAEPLIPKFNANLKFQQRRVSSQLATFFNNVFILSDMQTCKHYKFNFVSKAEVNRQQWQ